jgi:hypothetical protein
VDVASLQSNLEQATTTINNCFRIIFIFIKTQNLFFKTSIENLKTRCVDDQWVVFANNLNFDQNNSTDTVNIFRDQVIKKIGIIVDNIIDEGNMITSGRLDPDSSRMTNECIDKWIKRIQQV